MRKFIFLVFVTLFSQNSLAQDCISKFSAIDIIKANLGYDEFNSMNNFLSFDKALSFSPDENLYEYYLSYDVNTTLILKVTCRGVFSEDFSSWPE